ncbi:UNVERIFIED_CONTAM: hypothetical protein Slati_3955900 [Sesamum latifolium]|uniref:RNase H type-1 domain-containing protein n=1 Tax=Sesamum latifolium TaxID=2727402 RepID=A0AAW2TNB4_9LAMI
MMHFWRASSPYATRGHVRLLIPMLILWLTWKLRNDVKFNDANFSARKIIKGVISYLWKIHKAGGWSATNWKGDLDVALKLGFKINMPRAPLPKLICWIPLDCKWWKLNYDGASKGNRSLAGAGGLARDCQGNLIFAFYDFLDVQTNIYAKLFVVVRGLQLARERGCRQIWVEMDTMVVLRLILKDEGDWRLQMLLTRLRVMRRGMDLLFTCLL